MWRRPNEVVSLHRDCLQFVAGSPTLIWDNHKRRRLGRRLPIHASTADIITGWQQRRAALPQLQHAQDWLFPGLGSRTRETAGHVTAQHFISKVFRAWIDRIEEPFIAGTGPTGQPRVISKDSITAYGLRHAYAQRHADNGTPIDVATWTRLRAGWAAFRCWMTAWPRRRRRAQRRSPAIRQAASFSSRAASPTPVVDPFMPLRPRPIFSSGPAT